MVLAYSLTPRLLYTMILPWHLYLHKHCRHSTGLLRKLCKQDLLT